MMVEINFLELKKRNMLLYGAITAFLVLLLISSSVLLWQKSSQDQTAEALERQLQANSQKQTEVQDKRILQQSRQTLSQHVSSVEAMAFPTLALVDRMISLLPEKAYFQNFSYDRASGLTMEIQVENLDQVAAYTNALEQESYILESNLNSVNEWQASSESTSYIASFFVQIDEQLWIGETANED